MQKTLQEAWTNTKPNVSHLKTFGCKTFAHIPNEKKRKLNPNPYLVCF
jgi:hypothetical protein